MIDIPDKTEALMAGMAFDRGFIGGWIMGFEHFREDLERARALLAPDPATRT